ncbi:hypothetical protein [Thiorhodococcus minor]|uniref:Uncharacterized protein n=1 Tax=Thiorhodococcus minor TaxID=57489 RepID=A0A6M0K086_9GAMM|nr:hypothetical protein [Thiorhodococcus minor]NEV62779.1 hypothetical protein [Thiorhodococcus minor]
MRPLASGIAVSPGIDAAHTDGAERQVLAEVIRQLAHRHQARNGQPPAGLEDATGLGKGARGRPKKSPSRKAPIRPPGGGWSRGAVGRGTA